MFLVFLRFWWLFLTMQPYISPRRILRKKIKRWSLELKKHIHRYQYSLTVIFALWWLGLIIYLGYRYFLSSSIWQIQLPQIEQKSIACYPDQTLADNLISTFEGSNYRLAKLGRYPHTYDDLKTKYPVLWDIEITLTDSGYFLYVSCSKPNLVWHIWSKLVGSRSGVFLPLYVHSPLISWVAQAYLPDYITHTDLQGLYHTIPEYYILNILSSIDRLRWPVRVIYLIWSDKIQIIGADQKKITLSMTQSLVRQHQAIVRLSKNYFWYKDLQMIDCSNLNHIVVKK